MDALRQKLIHYEKDKASLARLRSRLADAQKSYRNLEFEHEVLQQRFDNLQKEKDTLHEEMEAKLYEANRVRDLKKQISEKKINVLKESLEVREAQIAESIVATEAVPADTNEVRKDVGCYIIYTRKNTKKEYLMNSLTSKGFTLFNVSVDSP